MIIDLAITDCLVVRDGKFLVIAEGKAGREGKFNLPGGHVDPDEFFATAAAREVLEESGYQVKITGFLGIYQHIYEGRSVNVGGPVFLAEVTGGKATPTTEHPEVKWITAEEAAQMERDGQFWPVHPAKVIADYQRRGAYPLDAVQSTRG